MRLAIADPPYPPIRAAHPRNDSSRAQRWYGDPTYRNSGDAKDRKADFNPEAHIWDDPKTHQDLMARLEAEFDGWAIATAHDSIPVYGALPRGARIFKLGTVLVNPQPEGDESLFWNPFVYTVNGWIEIDTDGSMGRHMETSDEAIEEWLTEDGWVFAVGGPVEASMDKQPGGSDV